MPERIQLRRQKGWRMPPDAVKVDRTTRWGNPFNFKRSEYCWIALAFGCRADPAGRQKASVLAYREWVGHAGPLVCVSMERSFSMIAGDKKVQLGPTVKAGVAPTHAEIRDALRGKDLACWCAPGTPCHADVLIEIANADA